MLAKRFLSAEKWMREVMFEKTQKIAQFRKNSKEGALWSHPTFANMKNFGLEPMYSRHQYKKSALLTRRSVSEKLLTLSLGAD